MTTDLAPRVHNANQHRAETLLDLDELFFQAAQADVIAESWDWADPVSNARAGAAWRRYDRAEQVARVEPEPAYSIEVYELEASHV